MTTKTSTKTAAKTAKKKTTKQKAAKAKTAKAKAKVQKASEEVKEAAGEVSEAAEKRFEGIIAQIRENLSEAREALAESGHVMDDRRREIAMQLIKNMQENADETFDSLEHVVNADSFGETLRISRDALRSGIERNVRQVKDIAEVAASSTRDSVEPVAEYFANLRDKASSRTNA